MLSPTDATTGWSGPMTSDWPEREADLFLACILVSVRPPTAGDVLVHWSIRTCSGIYSWIFNVKRVTSMLAKMESAGQYLKEKQKWNWPSTLQVVASLGHNVVI